MQYFILTQKNALLLFLFLASLYLILTIVGGIENYSLVPYFDMWDGYLGFYKSYSSGDLNAWWIQHNEHRIVLSKILFWLDLNLLKGQGIFLLFINYLLASMVFLVIYKMLQEMLPQSQDKFTKYIIGLTIFCWVFSLLQYENFFWTFQSQFFLVQLFPLCTFFLLHKAYQSKTYANEFFILVCLLGVLSIGTMINGILTLPLLTLLAIMLRMHGWQIISLFLLAVVTIIIYFYDYQQVYHLTLTYGGLTDTLLKEPMATLKFALLYLGNPFTVIFNTIMIQCAAIFLFISTLWFTYKAIKMPETSSLKLAIITFIFYVCVTALATGSGRLLLGESQALVTRYTTPTLIAWSLLLVLYAPIIAKQVKINWHRILPLVLIPLLWLPEQFKALNHMPDWYFDGEVAALALELGIKDDAQLAWIYYSTNEHVLSIANFAAEHNLSIFGNPLIKDAAVLMGQKKQTHVLEQCKGELDEVALIDQERGYVRVSGWLFNPENGTVPPIIHILNDERRVVGYALTGKNLENVHLTIDKKAKFSGFKGYLLSQYIGQDVFLQESQFDCEVQVSTSHVVLK